MIKLLTLEKNDKSQLSRYKPSKEVVETISATQQMAQDAEQQRNTSLTELDGYTFYEYLNICQDRYNENTPEGSSDPVDAWKSNTIRPFTRNKVRAIAAQATTSILFPFIEARNEDGDEDKALSIVMKDIMEDVLERDDYTEKLIDITVDLLTKPLAIVKQGFFKHMKEIKQIQEDGSYEKKKVLDHIYSGFRLFIIPPENLYLGNINEPNLQKQPYLIEHNLVGMEDARARYGHLDYFKYVQGGRRVFLDENTKTFFSQEITDLSHTKVEELIVYVLSQDLELRFLGGILIDNDPNRPIQQLREDKVYPYAANGYERIHNKFAYFRPIVWNLKNIQDDLDILEQFQEFCHLG